MNFPTEQLQSSFIRPQTPQNWTATKDIIHEMTHVHGKDNVPSQNTVYRCIQDIKNGNFEHKRSEET